MKKSNYIGIKLYNGDFLPILKSIEIKTKKVILTTVKDNQKKTIIELYEGSSNKCIENDYLGKLIIPIKRETKKGDPAIEVHLRKDKEGMVLAKAVDPDSGEKSQIEIESSPAHTLAADLDNKTQKYHEDVTKIEAYSGNKSDILRKAVIIAAIIILAALLSFLVFLGIKGISALLKNQKKAPVKVEKIEPVIKQIEKEEEKKEITGIKNLEGIKHFIKRGDNLWNICKKYYEDPWYYTDLAEINNIKNPRLIYAGTYITIPDKNSLKRYK